MHQDCHLCQNESHFADNIFHEHSLTQMLMMLPTAFDHSSSFVVSFDYIPIKFIVVGINFKCVCVATLFSDCLCRQVIKRNNHPCKHYAMTTTVTTLTSCHFATVEKTNATPSLCAKITSV